MNEQERILCAAILYDNVLIAGYRHSDCIQAILAFRPNAKISQKMQGFLTSKNRFIGRDIAASIAWKAGQIEEQILFLLSEDLY